jgi:dihydroceramidase
MINTVDWCEENYQVTYYLVEFWNSISSVVIALLALYLLVFSLKHGLEKRFLAWEIAFFTVGVGSTLFHGSLRYEWQVRCAERHSARRAITLMCLCNRCGMKYL